MAQADHGLRAAVLGLAGSALLGACAADREDVANATLAPSETPRLCDAAPAQRHVGQQASEATGAAILKDSGARTLRWGPPRSAWTMDYRQDRVNVRYDDAMKIIDVTCG